MARHVELNDDNEVFRIRVEFSAPEVGMRAEAARLGMPSYAKDSRATEVSVLDTTWTPISKHLG